MDNFDVFGYIFLELNHLFWLFDLLRQWSNQCFYISVEGGDILKDKFCAGDRFWVLNDIFIYGFASFFGLFKLKF